MEGSCSAFQDSYFVGYIKQVSTKFVTIHFPSSILLKKFYWNSESLHAGIVGNYILIEGEDHGFLGHIIEIDLPEKERLSLNQTAFEKDEFHPIAKAEILLSFDFYKMKAEKGLNQLPPIGSKVFVCSSDILLSFLRDFGKSANYPDEPGFEIATLSSDVSCKIKISPQAMFCRHCAIVGTTGGGKSFTVAKLLEEIVRNNGKAVLFDATGEYDTFSSLPSTAHLKFNQSGEKRAFLHHTTLYEHDLIALFRPAGQIQLPKLQDAFKSLRLVKLLKERNNLDKFDNELEKIYITSNDTLEKASKDRNKLLAAASKFPELDSIVCDFDITKLGYQIYNECVFEQGTTGHDSFGIKNERDLGNCYSLISRVNLAIKNTDFASVFGLNDKSGGPGDFFTEYKSFVEDKGKNLLIVDVSRVPSDNNLQAILINAFGRFFLQKSLDKIFKNEPLLLILDEAHLFLNKKVFDEYSIEVSLNSFERIAKECRKFGLFLILSTQMPRDIPTGILSQFGTFIVHRLINQRDRETIEFACSEATKTSLSFLPSLVPGQALFAGVEFPMPIILQIQKPTIEPDSSTPQIFKS